MLVGHCVLSVTMVVTSDNMVEWRCVSTALGAPSVMTSGMTEMPVCCADRWDTLHMVDCTTDSVTQSDNYVRTPLLPYIVHAIFPQTIAMIQSKKELIQLIPPLDTNTNCLHKTDGL